MARQTRSHTSTRPVGKALRAAIIVTVVAVLMNTVIDIGSSGFYATFCSFVLLILADFGGPPRSRFFAYIGTGIAGMVLITIGAFAAAGQVLALVVTALVSAVLAYSVLLRGYVGQAYVSLLLTYVVAVTTPQPVHTLLSALAAYFGGALVAAIAAVTMWPSYEDSAIRRGIGNTLAAASRLLAASAPLHPDADQDEVAARLSDLNDAEAALSKVYDGKLSRPGNASRQDRGLVDLVSDVMRLRIALRWPADRTADATPADMALLQAVNETLAACGKAMLGEGPVPDSDRIRSARDEHIRQLPGVADELLAQHQGEELVDQANASFYFRVTSFITEMIVRHTRQALGKRSVPEAETTGSPSPHPGGAVPMVDSVSTPGRMLSSNLSFSSPWLRRALQTLVAVTATVAVIQLLHLHEGFWAVLGVMTALKLDAEQTRKTVWGAAIGTVGGFALAVLMLWLVGDNIVMLIVLLPIVAFFATWFPAGRFELPLKQAGFSLWFIMLVSLAQGGLKVSIDDTRLEDVGVGLLASLLVTAIMWPNGVATRVRDVLKASAAATADYFTAAYRFITSPMAGADSAALQDAASRARKGRVQALDAFDVAIAAGGEAGQAASSWTSVAGSVDHVYFAAATVGSFPGYHLAPIPDPHVGELLCRSSQELARSYEQIINDAYEYAQAAVPKHSKTPVNTPSLEDISAAVNSAILGYEGQTGAMDIEIASRPTSLSYGEAAISMEWALEWLRYFHWMSTQTESLLEPAPERR